MLEEMTEVKVLTPSLTVYFMWVVTYNPSDFPGLYVVRKFLLSKAEDGTVANDPTSDCWSAETIDAVREKIPDGHTCVPRRPHYDPVIVEVWTTEEGAEWLRDDQHESH